MQDKPIPTRAARIEVFLERLRAAPPASSRDDALALMKATMDSVERELVGANAPPGSKMHVYGWEYDWNTDRDPWYWDDDRFKVHRTEIYKSGRIVITNMRSSSIVVLDKPGK
jgi:hypothetical protein